MAEDTLLIKRRSERRPARIAVTLVLEGDVAEQVATSIDLAQHGMRLQTDHPLTPGQPVGLLLSDDPPCLIRARVVWVGKAETGQAGQAGLQFLNPLGEAV
jgi:hypothetical protein